MARMLSQGPSTLQLHLSSGSSRMITAKPRLEHEHRPKRRMPIAPPREVFLPARLDYAGIEKSLPLQAGGLEQIFGPTFERSAKPAANRHREAHFRALKEL